MIQGITSVIQALAPNDAIDPVSVSHVCPPQQGVFVDQYKGILGPIVQRLGQAITASRSNPVDSQPALVQSLNALTACFKGLSPSDDEMWDLTEDEEDIAVRNEGTRLAREDGRINELRGNIESALSTLVSVWNGDGEVADVSLDLSLCPPRHGLTLCPVDIIIGQACHHVFRHSHCPLATAPTPPRN